MFKVDNNVARIDGTTGKYDGIVKNQNTKYGRNAASNLFDYMNAGTVKSEAQYPNLGDLSKLSDKEFQQKMKELENAVQATDNWLDNLPPLEYEYRYLPTGNIEKEKDALLGAAYEELGGRTEVSVKEMTSKMQEAFGNQVSAKAMDVNNDGKISLGEYSTSILLSDILSSEKQGPSVKDVNGVITSEGSTKQLAYGNTKNYDIASKTYKSIFEAYDLKEAEDSFTKDSNNLA